MLSVIDVQTVSLRAWHPPELKLLNNAEKPPKQVNRHPDSAAQTTTTDRVVFLWRIVSGEY